MPISITGKRIVVTGGAGGLAEATIHELVKEGADVVFFVRNDKEGERVATTATSIGPGTAKWLHVDIRKRAEVFSGVDKAIAQLRGLDVLFNIAGVEQGVLPEEITEEQLDVMFDTNIKGTVFVNQAVFPHFKANGGGSIVNFGSDAAMAPFAYGVHYAASKGAVHSFTRSLANAWGKYNIRVNVVAPAISSPMYLAFRERLTPEGLAAHEEDMGKMITLGGKLGDPVSDLAPVMVFLASDASKFITGQVICVNGGLGQAR
jgi:NAD(P)-dependent dehydrogenase (short-subunit alcohol dehydrogenase family)